MKCVILAAGNGVRMMPLTTDTPKPMLKVAGKPLLEHIINTLPEEVDEVILVVGYLKDKIIEYFGNNFGRLKITYVVQEKKSGTFDALKLCEEYLDDNNFLLLYADDLHGPKALKECVNSDTMALVVAEVEDPRRFGVVEVDHDGMVIDIEEKPENPKSNLVSNGVLLINKKVFEFPAKTHDNGERYLADSIGNMVKAGQRVKIIKSDFWLPIGYPEDLKRAEEVLASK